MTGTMNAATPLRPPPFGSVLTAMVTPFSESGNLDLAGAAALTEHLLRSGHDGLVVSGTTGESPSTTDVEKSELLRVVCDVARGRAKVVAGIGTYDTAHSLKLAAEAQAAGADGLLVVTPYYSKPPQHGILAHIAAIAGRTELPIMLYDIPGRCGVKLAEETLVRAAELPQVQGVKDASGDFEAASWVLARTDLTFYSGDDALNLPWLALGARGIVSVVGHLAGGSYRTMVDAMAKGDLGTARQAHQRVLPLVRLLMGHTQGAIMVKAALQQQGILASSAVRSPLAAATDFEIDLLTRELPALLEASA